MINVLSLLASVLAVICVFAPHEFAHAYVAYKNGDATAKMHGRMTLNPMKHIDPMGFIMCAIVGFGWAKPVPIDPYNFRKYRVGLFTTAIAGITVNYIIAFVAYPLAVIIYNYALPAVGVSSIFYSYLHFFEGTFELIFVYSLCSVVFNLLPFFPLDGFRVVESLTRPLNPVHKFLKEYGQMLLIILIVESFACDLLFSLGVEWAINFDILGYVLVFARNIIGWPISALWNLILL